MKREGRRFHTALFTLASASSEEPRARVGIIVGRRFGSAVARNRAKRMFRELARACASRLVGHRAFLVFPKRQMLDASYTELRRVWLNALERERLLARDSLVS